jgi:hypothetical protein
LGHQLISSTIVYISFIIHTYKMARLEGRQELQFDRIYWGQLVDNLITLVPIIDYNNQIADLLQTGFTG